MFAIFDTLEEYHAKNTEISLYRGYPDANGTITYAPLTPLKTIDNKYAMQIVNDVAHLFAGCKIVEQIQQRED